MTRPIALYRAPAGTMLRTFQPARDLLSDWRASDPAVIDAALEVLAESEWHKDKAICAQVREEREYAADLIFAEPGVPVLDRFPSLAPPHPEPYVEKALTLPKLTAAMAGCVVAMVIVLGGNLAGWW